MKYNKEIFDKAILKNKIVRYNDLFEKVVKDYLEIEEESNLKHFIITYRKYSDQLVKDEFIDAKDDIDAICRFYKKYGFDNVGLYSVVELPI
jgi:hypothetical protein